MRKRLASLALSAMMAGPLAAGATALSVAPVAAVTNSCQIYAYVNHPQTLEFGSQGAIVCSPGAYELHVRVHLQICTVDIFGCKTWADYTGAVWNDYSNSYTNPIATSLTGPWHYKWVDSGGHRFKVEVEGWYLSGAGGYVYVGKTYSQEVTN